MKSRAEKKSDEISKIIKKELDKDIDLDFSVIDVINPDTNETSEIRLRATIVFCGEIYSREDVLNKYDKIRAVIPDLKASSFCEEIADHWHYVTNFSITLTRNMKTTLRVIHHAEA